MAYESSEFSLSVMDHSEETSTLSFHIIQLGAATFAAHITARDAFIDAVENIIDGVIQRSKSTLDKNFNSTPPANPESSREKKVLVTMTDGTTLRKFSFTVPCRKAYDADWGVENNSDRIDMTLADAVAFISAANNFVRSQAGNASTVTRMTAVGRNL